MKQNQKRPEDQHLVEDQFEELNKAFYKRSPADYFERRIRGLMLASSSSRHISDAVREGLSVGGFNMREVGEPEPRDAVVDRDFISVESMAIQQHACESFLRLFLAHRLVQPCPWLEVARLRNFTEFHSATAIMRQELGSDDLADDLQIVFRGSKDPEWAEAQYPGLDWAADRAALVRLAGEVLDVYEDHRTAYNATKHGLAVLPDESGIDLGKAGEFVIERSGPTISWLEILDNSDGKGKRWYKSTRWVTADADLAFAHLVSVQLDSLWTVARARYLNTSRGTVSKVAIGAFDEIDRLRRDNQDVLIHQLGEGLLYWEQD